MRNRVAATVIVLGLLLAACGQQAPGPTDSSGPVKITVAGSTTVQPLAERLAESYSAKYSNVSIDIQGGGSSVGVKSVGEGTVDIGTVSREVKPEEMQQYPDLKVFVIARDGIAVIVSTSMAIDGLTKDQVRSIFGGQITNWKEVGGPDQIIVVVSREEGSGTRTAFEELVMGKDTPIVASAILQPSNGAVRTTVSTTPYSVGYLSLGYLDSSVKALAIDGVMASEANAANGTYPIVRPLNMLTQGEPSGAVNVWLAWILGPEGQEVVAAEGYIPVK